MNDEDSHSTSIMTGAGVERVAPPGSPSRVNLNLIPGNREPPFRRTVTLGRKDFLCRKSNTFATLENIPILKRSRLWDEETKIKWDGRQVAIVDDAVAQPLFQWFSGSSWEKKRLITLERRRDFGPIGTIVARGVVPARAFMKSGELKEIPIQGV